MTWKFIPEHGYIIDPDVSEEDSGQSSYRYYGGKRIAESINSENGPVLAEAQNMVALLKKYVADDPCAPNDPRYKEACEIIERVEPLQVKPKCVDCGKELGEGETVCCEGCTPF